MPADRKGILALRRKAKKLLLEAPGNLALTSGTDLKGLVHEFSVYQIELEMQNEELRRSQKQLKESRSEYADLYDFAPVGYITFDESGLITRANLTACGLLGIERSLFVRKHFALFIHLESQDPFYFHKRKVLETKTTQTCQLVLKRKDGTFFDAQLKSAAVQVDGQPAINSILTDITDRKRAEGEREQLESQLRQAHERKMADEALRRSEEQFRALAEHAPDVIDRFDRGMRHVYMNPAGLHLHGKEVDDVIGKTIRETEMAEPYCTLWEERLQKVFATGEVSEVEDLFPTVDGMKFYQSRLVPEYDSEGNIAFVLAVSRDITEHRKAEEALREHQQELEERVQERTAELQDAYDRLREEVEERRRVEQQLRQSQKIEALGTLTGGIAHDFNNILFAMIGFAQLAGDKLKEGSQVKRHLDRVLDAGLRGRELVRQMLLFSRKAPHEKKPLRLSSIIKETMKILRPSIPATIDIRVRIKHESGMILADPVQMEQVLMNLATNAAYAMREKGGILEVELDDFSVSSTSADPHGMRPGPYMLLRVRDSGEGMTEDVLAKIYDPFFTTKERGEGTGLGLSVAHGIVKECEGYITAESRAGEGTTFSLCFPKIPEEARDEENAAEAIPTGHEKILFVDDEEALVEMGHETLTGLGYHVESRTSSREALSLLRLDPSRFDLLITDHTMRDMTGIELAREVLAVRPDMKVILCTGFSHTVSEESAQAAGIKAFAMKPLTKREIARTIRKVLDG
jgi:PAS domain S-box-containing protein